MKFMKSVLTIAIIAMLVLDVKNAILLWRAASIGLEGIMAPTFTDSLIVTAVMVLLYHITAAMCDCENEDNR